jgi:hypothetical protein
VRAARRRGHLARDRGLCSIPPSPPCRSRDRSAARLIPPGSGPVPGPRSVLARARSLRRSRSWSASFRERRAGPRRRGHGRARPAFPGRRGHRRRHGRLTAMPGGDPWSPRASTRSLEPRQRRLGEHPLRRDRARQRRARCPSPRAASAASACTTSALGALALGGVSSVSSTLRAARARSSPSRSAASPARIYWPPSAQRALATKDQERKTFTAVGASARHRRRRAS